jgi:hypothetical protein
VSAAALLPKVLTSLIKRSALRVCTRQFLDISDIQLVDFLKYSGKDALPSRSGAMSAAVVISPETRSSDRAVFTICSTCFHELARGSSISYT